MTTSPNPILYTANATALGGREGSVKTDDGMLDMRVEMPKSMGGKGGAINPEQLFAAGYAACFGSAIGVVSKAKKVPIGQVQVNAQVAIGKVGDGFGLAVELEATIGGVSPEVGQMLLEAAHQVCPYSIATRGNIPVGLKLAL